MNKTELVAEMAEESGLTKADSTRALEAFLEVVGATLEKGEEISLVGFGTLKLNKRAARKGRNPKTGEEIDIAASNIPALKAGKALKERVNK